MRLSISNLAWRVDEDQSKVVELLDKYGVEFVELANRKQNFDQVLESGRKVCSMQSIFDHQGFEILGSELDRSMIELKFFKAQFDAENLGCRNIVYGCPKSRRMPEFDRSSRRDRVMSEVVNMFREISSAKKSVTVAIEPVVERYGSQFLTNFRDAVRFVKKIDRPNIKVNLDLANVLETGVRSDEVIRDLKYVSHIHVSEESLGKLEYHEEIAKILRYIEEHESNRLIISIEALDLTLEELEESIKIVKSYAD